jgi:hypothetical protein
VKPVTRRQLKLIAGCKKKEEVITQLIRTVSNVSARLQEEQSEQCIPQGADDVVPKEEHKKQGA